ncbi:MAG TPA: histidine--tRNA ligase [Clostridiaceae bacterium]|jgi:histidyl-tRNA synthetase|nr:histidine--tRNA ligase [Clostridiaceae bacterium]
MPIQAPRGTRDILPDDINQWNYVEKEFALVCKKFGYKEIRLPVFEYTELFQRGVGDTTDVVQKEMYTFEDKGGRSITLRPEGTAGVVRSYIEHGMSSLPQPVKLFYQITAYRYEKVQKGRYREFHQFGVELLGAADPAADVEVISMLSLFFNRLGIKNLKLNLNSIGCPECRSAYNELLKSYLADKIGDMCDTCKTRYGRNPMRILDCKEELCKKKLIDAPALLDHICDDCREHFNQVTKKLDTIDIHFDIDKNIVRGLDYYTRTVFEFVSENIGTQGTVCGGGRYDGLVEACGGAPTPGIGFALGVERLLLEMNSQGIEFPIPETPDIYIGAIGEKAGPVSEKLAWQLRNNNIYCIKDIMGRSVRAQMKYADKLGVRYSLILGDNEIESNKAQLRDMKTGEVKDISLDTLIDRLVKNKG